MSFAARMSFLLAAKDRDSERCPPLAGIVHPRGKGLADMDSSDDRISHRQIRLGSGKTHSEMDARENIKICSTFSLLSQQHFFLYFFKGNIVSRDICSEAVLTLYSVMLGKSLFPAGRDIYENNLVLSWERARTQHD